MQVIGIGCVCGGGGEKNHIYFTEYPLSVSALIYISWLFGRRSIAVRKKKKNHTAQHEPLFIAHIGEEGGMAAVEDILPCL